MLHNPDIGSEFVVPTDASDLGMGSVSSQVYEKKVGAFHSLLNRKFLPREERYCTVEEYLTMKMRIPDSRIHILGRKLTVMTDYRALECLNKMRVDNSRLTQWSLSLQFCRLTVKYRCRRMHGNVDVLSTLEKYLSYRQRSPPPSQRIV